MGNAADAYTVLLLANCIDVALAAYIVYTIVYIYIYCNKWIDAYQIRIALNYEER